MIFKKSHPAPRKIRRDSHYEKLTSESVLERQREQKFQRTWKQETENIIISYRFRTFMYYW